MSDPTQIGVLVALGVVTLLALVAVALLSCYLKRQRSVRAVDEERSLVLGESTSDDRASPRGLHLPSGRSNRISVASQNRRGSNGSSIASELLDTRSWGVGSISSSLVGGSSRIHLDDTELSKIVAEPMLRSLASLPQTSSSGVVALDSPLTSPSPTTFGFASPLLTLKVNRPTKGIRNIKIPSLEVFTGLGLELTGNCPVIVTAVDDNSPAMMGGLRPGDVLHAVNGSLCEKLAHHDVVRMLSAALSAAEAKRQAKRDVENAPVLQLSGFGSHADTVAVDVAFGVPGQLDETQTQRLKPRPPPTKRTRNSEGALETMAPNRLLAAKLQNQAQILMEQGQYKEAERLLDRAIDLLSAAAEDATAPLKPQAVPDNRVPGPGPPQVAQTPPPTAAAAAAASGTLRSTRSESMFRPIDVSPLRQKTIQNRRLRKSKSFAGGVTTSPIVVSPIKSPPPVAGGPLSLTNPRHSTEFAIGSGRSSAFRQPVTGSWT
eukprot:m.132425 g.132425  ORF g.132425 m.132425 type:complete len:490 (-) comp16848_c0_seq1:216-1685(-)